MTGTSALNVDSACTGTTMGDYMRCTDLAHFPTELIDRYEAGNVVHLRAPSCGTAPSLA